MTALEQVMQMKREGKSEGEIIATLRNQGLNPMQISETLNQSKIKEAVYDSDPTEGMMPSIMQSESGENDQNSQNGQLPAEMPEPSSTPQAPQTNPENVYTPQAPSPEPQQYQTYAPSPQPQYEMPYGGPEPGYSDNYGGQNDYYQDQYAQNQDYYDSGYSAQSTDTIIEVAEQVFAEKMKNFNKEMRTLTEFKTIFETKVENLTNRLERMEKYFDKMQIQILEKVGEYGKGLDYMRKELKMVEDSVGKFSEKQ